MYNKCLKLEPWRNESKLWLFLNYFVGKNVWNTLPGYLTHNSKINDLNKGY